MTALPWLDVAYGELVAGVKEIPGREHEARILEYHATTTLRATTDEVPWCSSFANWCIETAGMAGTRSAAARSWRHWGTDLGLPVVGAVAVLWRGTPQGTAGHVGFVLGWGHGYLCLLGGNQGNAVSVKPYPLTQLLAYRWPPGVALP